MLTVVKKHLNLISKYFIFNLKCSLQYRVSFIMQVIGMIINNSSFLFFWWILYRNVNSIKGYTFADTLMLWGLAASTYAFTYIIFGNTSDLSNLIVNGGLDSYILQPKDIVINACASKTVISAWGDLLFGYMLLIFSGSFSLKNLALFSFFTIIGGLIFFATMLSLNSLAFFLGNIESSKRLVENFFLTFATYPEGIFGKYLKLLFYTLLPVRFLVYLPIGILKHFSLVNLLMVIVASIVYFITAYIIFYWGLKKYESGNLIQGKL